MRKTMTYAKIRLSDLQPNNWYINREKLDKVRKAWSNGEQDTIPPILVTYIQGQPSLIDGHSRAYAAYENGEKEIYALIEDLDTIEGSNALYVHIHNEGPKQGILSIADLASRIVESEEHQRLWIDYCTRWLNEHE